jgi:hypothetical protein
MIGYCFCREEGWAQGGIVVQDCLEFLQNLLFNNAPNQLMFRCPSHCCRPMCSIALLRPCNMKAIMCRELGHMARAMPMLHPPLEESRWGLPRQTASNLLSALGTVLLLISPPQANGRKQVR